MNHISKKKISPYKIQSFSDNSWANLSYNIFPPYNVAIDNTGTYLYITDGSNTITRVNINTQTIVSNWATSTQGIMYPVGMAIDPAGTYLYVVNGNNTVSQILLSDSTIYNPTWATSTQGIGGPSAIVISGLYMYIANPQLGTICQILLADPTTYNTTWVAPNQIYLTYPTSMAVDNTGSYLYVSNNVNICNKIIQFQISDPTIYNNNWATISAGEQPKSMVIDNTGTYLYLLYSSGGVSSNGSITQLQITPGNPPSSGTVNDTWLNSGLHSPGTMVFNPGAIYAVNNGNSTISQVQLGNPVSNPPNINNWLTLSFYISNPYPAAVVIDNTGTYMYVADSSNNLISQILLSDPTVYNPLWATSTQGLNDPSALAIDPTGTYLYVTNRIGGIDSRGTISQILLSNSSTYNATWATSTQGLNEPSALAIDPTGTYLYVANSSDSNDSINQILVSDPATYNATWATGLNYPTSIAINGAYMYVANNGNGSISQILVSDPTVYNATWAQGLNNPVSIVIDGTYMYVCDYCGGDDYYGSISQILLSDPATYNATWATSTQGLNYPSAMAARGNLYVANSGTLTIIQLVLQPLTPLTPIIRQYGYSVFSTGFRIYNTLE